MAEEEKKPETKLPEKLADDKIVEVKLPEKLEADKTDHVEAKPLELGKIISSLKPEARADEFFNELVKLSNSYQVSFIGVSFVRQWRSDGWKEKKNNVRGGGHEVAAVIGYQIASHEVLMAGTRLMKEGMQRT